MAAHLESGQAASDRTAIEQISADWATVWFKRVLPTLLFALVGLIEVLAVGDAVRTGLWGLPFIPLSFGFAFFLAASLFCFPLADSLAIDGQHLIVRNRGVVRRIRFDQVKRVVSFWINPDSVLIEVDAERRADRRILFAAKPQRWWWSTFQDHPVVSRLREQVIAVKSSVHSSTDDPAADTLRLSR